MLLLSPLDQESKETLRYRERIFPPSPLVTCANLTAGFRPSMPHSHSASPSLLLTGTPLSVLALSHSLSRCSLSLVTSAALASCGRHVQGSSLIAVARRQVAGALQHECDKTAVVRLYEGSANCSLERNGKAFSSPGSMAERRQRSA